MGMYRAIVEELGPIFTDLNQASAAVPSAALPTAALNELQVLNESHTIELEQRLLKLENAVGLFHLVLILV